MSDTQPLPDDPFVPVLVAYDEGLAVGHATPPPLPEEWQARFDADRAVLSELERAWPRSPHSAWTAGQPWEPGTDSSPPHEFPQRFGRFHLVRELGRGGHGVVFLAVDPALGRQIALKVPTGPALRTPELRARFLREGRVAAALDHPGIVPTFEAGEVGPICYLAIAYCDGPTLAAWLKEQQQQGQPVAARVAARLVADLAAAVEHAHGRGVLHRDLKPSNVLLQRRAASCSADATQAGDESPFTPRVGDFGLAKLLEAGEAGEPDTPSGAILGTPEYMAPEQAEGRSRDVGAAADVYALGVILYEVLTGRPPLRGASRLETMRRVVSEAPPRPGRFRPDLPPDLEAIVLACLEKDPARRYATAGALEADLRGWLAGQRFRRGPAGWSRRVRRCLGRHARLAAAAVVLASVLLVGSLAAWSLGPDREPKRMRAALERGQAVTLIGQTGTPRWSHWLRGEALRTSRGPGDAFRLSTAETNCLLELLPRLNGNGYKLSAKVRHEHGAPSGAVGIYFAHSKHATPLGEEHCLATVTFNDNFAVTTHPQTGQRVSRVEMNLWRCCATDGKLEPASPSIQDHFLPAALSHPGQRPWRTLEIEVEAEQVRVSWEGKVVGTVSRQALQQRFLQLNPPLSERQVPGLQPASLPAGGVGLYLSEGTASFQTVVLEPLHGP